MASYGTVGAGAPAGGVPATPHRGSAESRTTGQRQLPRRLPPLPGHGGGAAAAEEEEEEEVEEEQQQEEGLGEEEEGEEPALYFAQGQLLWYQDGEQAV